MRSMGFGGMAQPMSRGKFQHIVRLTDWSFNNCPKILFSDMLCIQQVREKMAEQWDQDIIRKDF